MSKAPRTVLMPGAPAAQPVEAMAPGVDIDDTLTPEEQLAALRAENARLQAQLATPAKPSVLFEPVTKHGAQALAASAFAHLTVEALMAKIDAGEAREPTTSVLCANGWYATRAMRQG
jgi:hypothetical protein